MAALADVIDNARLLTALQTHVDFTARESLPDETVTPLEYTFSINLSDFQAMSKAELWTYLRQSIKRLAETVRRTNPQAGQFAFRRFAVPAETANSRVFTIDRNGFYAVVIASRENHVISATGRTQTVLNFTLKIEIVTP